MQFSYSAPVAPLVPGWDVNEDDGRLVAARRAPLAERLATAEACHPKVAPYRRAET